MVVFKPRPTLRAQELRNSATQAERCLWKQLSRRQLNGYKFSRQMPVGPFICDFMCREAGLVIEVDGGQHDAMASQDASRTRLIEGEGLRLIGFWNNEVLDNIDGVLQAIADALRSFPPPAPPAGGRGV
jgi:very-short-patch-repair endonuclease